MATVPWKKRTWELTKVEVKEFKDNHQMQNEDIQKTILRVFEYINQNKNLSKDIIDSINTK